MKQVTYEGLTFEPYISKEEIAARVENLGRDIVRDCSGKQPLFICVLNGAFPFANDLFRATEELDSEITFIRLKSYEGTSTSGAVKEVLGLNENIEGRTIIIVEDIIDTGRTLQALSEIMKERGAKSVEVVSMLDKPETRVVDFHADYYGFKAPDEFLVGYGLDYNGLYRNLPYVGILKHEVYAS